MKNLSFEDENINEINKEKKGYLVNDSFGYMIQGNKENIWITDGTRNTIRPYRILINKNNN